jgi:hypothetical protein
LTVNGGKSIGAVIRVRSGCGHTGNVCLLRESVSDGIIRVVVVIPVGVVRLCQALERVVDVGEGNRCRLNSQSIVNCAKYWRGSENNQLDPMMQRGQRIH